MVEVFLQHGQQFQAAVEHRFAGHVLRADAAAPLLMAIAGIACVLCETTAPASSSGSRANVLDANHENICSSPC
jgi:hypothetical protein